MYVLTHEVLASTLAGVRSHMGALLKVVESVALVDLLQCFAAIVVAAPQPSAYVRPSFGSGPHAPTILRGGRHPILERVLGGAHTPRAAAAAASSSSFSPAGAHAYVANDVAFGPGATLHVLTGPNCSGACVSGECMRSRDLPRALVGCHLPAHRVSPPASHAGKSTYLKQVALLTVMAHLGCFVPAVSARFRLTDRICTRLGSGDDMEANASTFLKEVRVLTANKALGWSGAVWRQWPTGAETPTPSHLAY